MEFFKCSIASVRYGRGVTEIERTLAKRAGRPLLEEQRSPNAVRELAFNFDDECGSCHALKAMPSKHLDPRRQSIFRRLHETLVLRIFQLLLFHKLLFITVP